jgi:hypothetical protein
MQISPWFLGTKIFTKSKDPCPDSLLSCGKRCPIGSSVLA